MKIKKMSQLIFTNSSKCHSQNSPPRWTAPLLGYPMFERQITEQLPGKKFRVDFKEQKLNLLDKQISTRNWINMKTEK